MTTITLALPDTKRAFLFIAFGLIVTIPLTMVHSQWLTGPLVNCMLILTCVMVGPMEAVILGLLPSSVALVSGLLPLPLASMIPFIMIGNAIYVAVFYYFCHGEVARTMTSNSSSLARPRDDKRIMIRQIFGILSASFLKFLFLAASVRFLMATLLEAPIVQKLSLMMSWPQFYTAVIGGAIALIFLSLFSKRA